MRPLIRQSFFSPVVMILDSTLDSNFASVSGGGASAWGPTSLSILSVSFVNNTSIRDGGALALGISASANVTDSVFFQNHAALGKGGVFGLLKDARVQMVRPDRGRTEHGYRRR